MGLAAILSTRRALWQLCCEVSSPACSVRPTAHNGLTSFRWVGHASHEQDAAVVLVPNEEHKWVVGAEHGHSWWRGRSHSYCRSCRCFSALLVHVNESLVKH